MIDRPLRAAELDQAFGRSPIVAILGPRQCGKTTLARRFVQDWGQRGSPVLFLDAESTRDQRRLANPYLLLEGAQGLVVIDEIQTLPALFSALRVLVDQPDHQAKYLILGSAAPGRVEQLELSGFHLDETGVETWRTLWNRGGFPRSYLAKSDIDSSAWRENFIRTFLERDIPQLGITIPAAALRRFWTMLAHFHGQTWNASELGRSMGLSDKTVRSYLDLLTGTFMVRQLQPWYENVGKRQVKAPKIYFRDTGLLHHLLDIRTPDQLLSHGRLGASWEGFALEETLRAVQPDSAWFWSVHSGGELDLLLFKDGRRLGFEFKYTDAPELTRSMTTAAQDLGLDSLSVVYPGTETYPLSKTVQALPLTSLVSSRSHPIPH